MGSRRRTLVALLLPLLLLGPSPAQAENVALDVLRGALLAQQPIALPLPATPGSAAASVTLTPTEARGPHGAAVALEGEEEGDDVLQLWRAVAVVTGVVGASNPCL